MSPLARRLAAATPWTAVAERDVSYMRVADDRVLVVACDSHGGLGPKAHDTIAVEPAILGRFALRVPLLELIATGATPRLVVDALAVERDPTGDAIIAGIRAEADAAGIDPAGITGSTEENVATVATGLGVTVIGDAPLDRIRVGRSASGCVVFLLGRPMSAPRDVFGPDEPGILTVEALRSALSVPGVVEALPIGSAGVAAEFAALGKTVGCRVETTDDWPCEPDQSGGPSTAALLTVLPDGAADTARRLADIGLPLARLGSLQ